MQTIAPQDRIRFITAGKAVLTLKSEKTGRHFTYLVEKSDDGNRLFVKALTGPDNTSNFTYIGYCYLHIASGKPHLGPLRAGAKGDIGTESARAWIWAAMQAFCAPSLSVYHEGRCAACGRRLTTPESIETGFGPECVKRID